MNNKEARILIGIILLLSIPFTLASYEANIREDIFLVRPDNPYIINDPQPTYLENEDLIFFACLEQQNTPVRLSVLCQDTNEFVDVQARRFGPLNCYVGSTNLEQLDCTQALVQADYVSGDENLRLTREIRINKFSNTLNRVVETQFTDGGWQTPLDTAYGLLVLASFPEIFPERIARALEYLRINRDDENKCWPQERCRVSTTANILFLLDKAGFEDLRLQHDGRIYLEKTQNYLTTENWTIHIQDHPFNINNTLDTSCVYDYRDRSPIILTLDKYPAVQELSFRPEHNAYTSVVCTENIIARIKNQFGERIVGYHGDNFTYTIPPPCWTKNNENITCDTRTTLFAINSPLNTNQRQAALNHISSLVQRDRTAGSTLGGVRNTINDALYLYATTTNQQDFITNLRYYQANSGAWHMHDWYYERSFYEVDDEEYNQLRSRVVDQISKDIVNTGYAVMALLRRGFERTSEVIMDAERWVSIHEDATSLNVSDEALADADTAAEYLANTTMILEDIKRNAMAFYVLRNNARPLLVAQPSVIIMNRQRVEVDIINPTIFDLEDVRLELSDSLAPYIEVEQRDFVGAYSRRRVPLELRTDRDVSEIGYLRLLKDQDEYLRIPVILESAPTLEIQLAERLTVFGSTTTFPFQIQKSNHDFSCSLEWETPGISSAAAFSINNLTASTYNFPVRFAVLETENRIYEGTIECVANRVRFVVPFAVNVQRFSNRPFEVFPQLLSLNEEEPVGEIQVSNLLDQGIDIEIRPQRPDPFISLSDAFISLFPGETRTIRVEAIPPEGENYSTSNNIVFTALGVEERVLFTAEIIAVEQQEFSLIIILIGAGILLVILTTGGVVGYKKREELRAWYTARFKKEDVRAQVLRKVAEMEREEELLAVKNMMRIHKLQGLKDTEVRAKLLAQGYTETDIDQALTFSPVKSES